MEAGGIAWMTSREAPGVIIVVPDRTAHLTDVATLPPGISAITTSGDRITT